MEHQDDSRHPVKTCGFGEPADGQRKESTTIATAGKAIRAVTAIVVFGVPLLTGTAALLGYGAYKAYKRISGRS